MAIIKHIKKTYLLAAGCCLLLVISYQLAFKKTLAVWRTYNNLTAASASPSSMTEQPQFLERKARNLRAIIRRYEADTLAYRNKVMDRVALIAEQSDVQITEAPLNVKQDAGLLKLTFEGSYPRLLDFLHKTEQTDGLGYLRSASFRVRRSSAADAPVLTLEIWWQNLR